MSYKLLLKYKIEIFVFLFSLNFCIGMQSSATAAPASVVYIDKALSSSSFKNANSLGSTYQLFSHGRSGELLLNGKWCNAQEIATFLQPKIQNPKFKIDNLNIYGCEFAKGAKGLQAVAYLQKTLGVSVSASTNITGKDGDWVLEVGKAKDVIAINNYNGNLQAGCTYGTVLNPDIYATSSTGDVTINGATAQGATGAPDAYALTLFSTGTTYQVVGTMPNTFTAGDVIRITAKDFAGYTAGFVLAFSIDGISYTTNSSVINGINSSTFTTVSYTLPATATGAYKYVRIQGATTGSYMGIDAIAEAISRCANAPISGVSYFDNGAGGGTAKNCVKDGTETGTIFSSGMYAKIKTVGGLSAISATALNANGTFTIPDVANGTYVVYLDNNNNLADFTPTNPTNYNGVISQTVTVTNGVVSPALNFCLSFMDSDGDGIGDDTDLDDDNDGILDVVECGCSAGPNVINPISASSSSNYAGSPASNTIASLSLSGTGLAAIKAAPLTLTNAYLMQDPNTTGWIDYNMAANTSINQVALWATRNTAWGGNDGPIKDFQVEVTYSGGVWTSGTYSTANPNLATNTNAQVFDLGQTFNNVTKVRIKILNGWYNVGNDGVTFVSTAGQPSLVNYNMTLGEFRAVNTCTADIDTDGDGIPNRLDLDSDNDGCSDAYESGVTTQSGVSMTTGTSGTVGGVSLANSVVVGADGANGFANSVETATESGIYKGNYIYGYAISNAYKTCADTDGDGIPDMIDLDDDNDGVLDVVECGWTGAFVNGSFESPVIAANNYSIMNQSLVPGWKTTASDSLIEIWSTGFNGVPSAQGNQFAELNANLASTLYQTIPLNGTGGFVTWSLKHRGRQGVDVASFNIGTTLTNATSQATLTDGNTAWGTYSGTYSIPAGTPNIVFAFQAISSAGGNNAIGNFLDDVVININQNCLDTDGDGTPNSLDLDSDNDGCGDAYESGTTTNPTVYVINGPYSGNGFADALQKSAAVDSNAYNGTYTYTNAITAGTNTCPKNKTNPDINITYANVPTTGNIAANDSLTAGTTFGTPQPQAGNLAGATITMNANGTYSFTATTAGVYNYLVPVCPTGVVVPNCPLELLTITVLDASKTTNKPVANTDYATTTQNHAITLNTLGNDQSGNAAPVILKPATVTITNQPKHGTVTVDTTTGNTTYTPATGYAGIDTLTYSVCNSNIPAQCATALQIITIKPYKLGNNYTNASDDYAFGLYNAPINGDAKANDTDPEGNSQTITAQTTTVTGKGTLVLGTDGKYTFTPVSGFTGPVSFPYTTCDNGTPQACAQATINLLVAPQNINLPIKIVAMNAVAQSCEVVLNWETGTAKDVAYFEIEKSLDGTLYQHITNVKAINSTVNQTYQYNDEVQANGKWFYRLKIVEDNGSYFYTNNMIVDTKCDKAIAVSLAPNPADNYTQLTINSELIGQKAEVRIVDMMGKEVFKEKLLINQNLQIINIDTHDLSTGAYSVIVNVNDVRFIRRLMKK